MKYRALGISMRDRAVPLIVDAYEIIEVSPVSPHGTMELILLTGEFALATQAMLARYIPTKGDYLVKLLDGLTLTPKAVFKQKFTPVGHQ